MTDKKRITMETRGGCFVTKSQANKLDSIEWDYVDYLVSEDDGELIVGLNNAESFMNKRGTVTSYE